jgi:hypothetical protein
MSVKKNRCSGCEHYEGEGSNDYAICAIKKHAKIDAGCSSFDADSTATCETCGSPQNLVE